ncbi:uncharacterized protein DNG_07723 [Cephalotrichum gorgonifer]|uniref:Uncharacterized protein n=1 Tax=Cephalotrichum gorgonifer TaxID=2041049 RepID=A0AAE8SXQ5_9PEZI|nr:uncharacterized protein DNG_07723 [Cephalotrichum gorgonifer]
MLTDTSDDWADGSSPGDSHAITPERVQSVLDARGHHPFFFHSLAYSDPASMHRMIITRNLQSFQSKVLRHRPLTDQEVEALTDHWSPSANVALSARPSVIALSLFLAWRGRARFRFPFWQPKWETTSPDVFPSLKYQILNGAAARIAWHTSRLAVYAAVCNWLVPPVFLSYAGVRAAVGISSDPRLKDAVKESVKDIEAQRRINHLHRTGRAPAQLPTEGQTARTGENSPATSRTVGWQTEQEEASPQSTRSQADDSQSWGIPQGDAVKTSLPRTYGTPGSQRQAPSPPSIRESDSWATDDPVFDEIDDASPVAPAARAAETRRQPQPRRPPPAQSDDGVSAWERLRENAQARQNDDTKR